MANFPRMRTRSQEPGLKPEELARLLAGAPAELLKHIERQGSKLKELAEIGLALSAEKDIQTLLELILDEARSLTKADAGTLYTVDPTRERLEFMILQNDTLDIRLGGKSGGKIELAPVPLYLDGLENHANVSSHVALTGQTINIDDVYEAEGFDFTGPRKYDQATGYRSRSMLVIPLKNHLNETIGVLQLLNALDEQGGEIVGFSRETTELAQSLASQAAVALTNAQLVAELKTLFYAFIKSIARAVDEKSPYTGGHVNRVVTLTLLIAEAVNNATQGPLADVSFNEDELEELKIASWLHDVGKIATPEHVIDKSTKLQTVFDRAELVQTRLELAAQAAETAYLRKVLALHESKANPELFDKAKSFHEAKLKEIREASDLIASCNKHPGYLNDASVERLRELAGKRFEVGGESLPFLNQNELMNLSVRKGTLNDSERAIVENHSQMTMRILGELPFPQNIAKAPFIASAHHERPNGSGYPYGLKSDAIPLQAKIMAVADVFEALTAKDRPYKEPMTLSQAIKILKNMEKDGHLDKDVLTLFLDLNLHLIYAREHLNPEQIDCS